MNGSPLDGTHALTVDRMSDQMHPVETKVIDEPQRVRGPLLYFVGRLAFARALAAAARPCVRGPRWRTVVP